MKKQHVIIKFIIFIGLLTVFTFLLWKPLSLIFSDIEKFKELVLGFGFFAPFVLIVLVILQVIIAPIPGQAAGLASGFLFGPVLGTLYSMIGLIIGSYIVFVFARKLGRPFVERVVEKNVITKFDKISSEKGVFTLFLLYLLPAIPDDAISFIAGLSKIKLRTLMLISAIGRFPGFLILNLVGGGLSKPDSTFSIILFVIFMAFSIPIFIYKAALEKLMTNLIYRLKIIAHNLC